MDNRNERSYRLLSNTFRLSQKRLKHCNRHFKLKSFGYQGSSITSRCKHTHLGLLLHQSILFTSNLRLRLTTLKNSALIVRLVWISKTEQRLASKSQKCQRKEEFGNKSDNQDSDSNPIDLNKTLPEQLELDLYPGMP